MAPGGKNILQWIIKLKLQKINDWFFIPPLGFIIIQKCYYIYFQKSDYRFSGLILNDYLSQRPNMYILNKKIPNLIFKNWP